MPAGSARVLVDGRAQAQVSPLDRGLLYGDGLFETIRFVDGAAPLWARHMQRLQSGCTRLGLPIIEPSRLNEEALRSIEGMSNAVVRITLTRGQGERGYRPPSEPQPTRIVAASAPPPLREHDYRDGIVARLCDLRLATQPALAGIKHLNRLEQVLARTEWNDQEISEGLLCDQDGDVICATMANLFAVIDGVLVTPPVDRCGVAGVARAEILAARSVQVCRLPLDVLAQADELFLSSSIRGILPLRAVGDRVFSIGPCTRALQRHWRDLGFFRELA
ncbi:MAG TPA: aminodeoxychorismate lyase [Dyella sp.]|uniref:aminodeoxychorismate lyase n=1 Tax=Dyella sp. TaxID=1869338 RepID=UPI002F9223E4